MKPAARVGDPHVCALVTGVVPHVGGPVLPPGFPTVLIGGMPDARIADLALCVGPPDPIAQGASTVLIGGLPASRMTDMSSHGGMIVIGFPTVLIGDPTVTINIKGDAAYAAAVQTALARILPTRSGVEWLRQMGLNGRAITIQPTNPPNTPNGFCTPANGTNAANGVGSDSTIDWNPNHHTTDAGLPGAQGTPGSDVILAHEMVHALHNANGADLDGPNDSFPGQNGSSARNEERSTVGTGGSPINTPTGPQANPPDYSGNVPTENSFRDDLGIPRRPTYYPSNWPGGPPW
jgi:uncharacterized Zn-binding protein involved in type VI secretion